MQNLVDAPCENLGLKGYGFIKGLVFLASPHYACAASGTEERS